MTVLFVRIQNNAATFWSESILKSRNGLKFNLNKIEMRQAAQKQRKKLKFNWRKKQIQIEKKYFNEFQEKVRKNSKKKLCG